MLVYSGLKKDFLRSVEEDSIAEEIEETIYNKMHKKTARNEFRSWENSLEYMYKVLNDDTIPENSGIAIEYNIPQTSKRVDFIISGLITGSFSKILNLFSIIFSLVITLFLIFRVYSSSSSILFVSCNFPIFNNKLLILFNYKK